MIRKAVCLLKRRPRFRDGSRSRETRRLRMLRAFIRLRPAPSSGTGIRRAGRKTFWGEGASCRQDRSADVRRERAYRRYRRTERSDVQVGIPITYVPARNTIFLFVRDGVGGSARIVRYFYWCECDRLFGLSRLPSGVHRSVRADGEPRDEGGRRRADAFANSHSARGIEQGRDREAGDQTSGSISRLTHSCYDPGENGRACGHCDSCVLRRKGFEEAGVDDPSYAQ